MCATLLVPTGVIFPDALTRSYTRSNIAETNLAGLVGMIQEIYLRLALCVDKDELEGHIADLAKTAKAVDSAAINALQRAFPTHQVFQGAIVAADVLLIAFSHGRERYMQWMRSDARDRPVDNFSWGPVVEFLQSWAQGIPHAARPGRPARQSPPRMVDALGLPNDFMLSGSTFCSSQDTLFDSQSTASEDSDFTPPGSRSARRKVKFSPPPKSSGSRKKGSGVPTILEPSSATLTPTKVSAGSQPSAPSPVPSGQPSPQSQHVPPSPSGFWALLAGPSPKVCTSHPEFLAASKASGLTKPEYLYTRDRDVADDALAACLRKVTTGRQAGRQSVPCFAVKGSRSGLHATRAGAQAVVKIHGGVIRHFLSKSKGRKWLWNYKKKRRSGALTLAEKVAIDAAEDRGDPTVLATLWASKRAALEAYVRGSVFVRPFSDEWIALQSRPAPPPAPPRAPAPPPAAAASAGSTTTLPDVFVVTDASGFHVAPSLADAQSLMAARADSHCSAPFGTVTEAQAHAAKLRAEEYTWYVVLRGHSTGVMRQAACVKAVSGFANPKMTGPFRTRHDADVAYH